MEGIISRLETIPISLTTIKKYKPDHCRVLLYDNLPNTVPKLFGNKSCVIILYTMHDRTGKSKNGVGHFALVMRMPNSKTLRYFSSYGLKPEAEIHITHSKGRLLKLLGRNYTYNRVQLQSSRRAQTCGLHALVRSYLYKLKNSAYLKLMKKYTARNPDDLVSIMSLILVIEELQSARTYSSAT